MPSPGPEPALGVRYGRFAWRYLPDHRHRKLFIGRRCKKRVDGPLKLSRHKLKMVTTILTGHAPMIKHLRTTGLFEGDPTCRYCRKEAETVHLIICGCEVLARQRCSVFGYPSVEPLPLYKRHRATLSVLNVMFRVAQ
jgi:hypothetical protein